MKIVVNYGNQLELWDKLLEENGWNIHTIGQRISVVMIVKLVGTADENLK